MKTPKGRHCVVCSISINHRRADAKTCTDACRQALCRRNKSESVLVQFRTNIYTHASMLAAALAAGLGIDAYLAKLINNAERMMH